MRSVRSRWRAQTFEIEARALIGADRRVRATALRDAVRAMLECTRPRRS